MKEEEEKREGGEDLLLPQQITPTNKDTERRESKLK
jgi:hypothetical protein